MSFLGIPERRDALSVILKLPGEVCNINCVYCYEKRKPYQDASFLEGTTLRRFLELCGDRPLSLELHGGEPLVVGERRMRDILAAIREYPGVTRVALQTNGLLLSDAWLRLLAEEWPDIEIG